MLVNYSQYPYKKTILFFANGKHHVDMFLNIFTHNPDICFVIYSPTMTVDDYFASSAAKYSHIIFTSDFAEALHKIPSFDAYISTVLQNGSFHVKGIELWRKCKEEGIKTYEIQHGMFQIGLHYADICQNRLLGSDSLKCYSRSDEFLVFYPVDDMKNKTVIGYPDYITDDQYTHGEYTLILSNMHWETYTNLERTRFYQSVSRLIAENPKQLFIWKTHHAELTTIETVKEQLGIYSEQTPLNLLFTSQTNILNLLTTADLIKKSKNVISSISTVLFDCERHKKPTLIYRASSTAVLADAIEDADFFTDYVDLVAQYAAASKPVHSGLLQKYDNTAFRRALGL